LGEIETDYNNRMVIRRAWITGNRKDKNASTALGQIETDYNNQMMTLSKWPRYSLGVA
jgi:hypothetical protein